MTEEMTALEAMLQERNEILARLRKELRYYRATKNRYIKSQGQPDTLYASTYRSGLISGLGSCLKSLGFFYRAIRCRWTPGGEHE